MNKSYYVTVLIDGLRGENYTVEAQSKTEAVFLVGLVFGQTYPEFVPNAHSITIEI